MIDGLAIPPFASGVDPSFFGAFIAFVLGGGLVGAVTAWVKAKPEGEGIAVKTMAYTLQVVRADMETQKREAIEREKELLAEIKQLRDRVAELETALAH